MMMMMMTLVVVIAMPMMLTQSTVTINEMIAAMTTSSMPSPMTYQLAPTRKTQPHPSAETNSPHADTRDSETPTLPPSSPALFAVTPGNTSHASCDRMTTMKRPFYPHIHYDMHIQWTNSPRFLHTLQFSHAFSCQPLQVRRNAHFRGNLTLERGTRHQDYMTKNRGYSPSVGRR